MPVIRAIAICGANGFVGAAILRHALTHHAIERVFVIVRKPFSVPIPAVRHKQSSELATAQRKKVSLIILPDFSNPWPQDVIDQLKNAGVRACIWCIGGPVASYPDINFAHRVNVELPLIALQALSTALAPAAEGTFSTTARAASTAAHVGLFSFYTADKSEPALPFRFIYFSMVGAERNQAASLWTQAADRKCKGAAEKALFDSADQHSADLMERETAGGAANAMPLEVYALRLPRIVPGGQTTANVLLAAVGGGINVERVAASVVDMTMYGRRDNAAHVIPGSAVIESIDVFGEDWAQINTIKV